MRRLFVAAVAAVSLTIGGPAVANPPDSDPTCGNSGGPASGEECAGDNGAPGCEGIDRARETPAGEAAADALDLVTDILGEGAESECD